MRVFLRPVLAGILIAVTALPAAAHVGHGEVHGLVHGFMHPISGLDHMLAMVAVGMLAAIMGERALWIVPLSFMAMMAVGGALAIAGLGVPYVELGISLSVVVLGAAVALQWPLPVGAAVALAGVFAVFHGYAHGAEMPVDASGASYGAGFLAATGLLHLAGIGIGLVLGRSAPTAGLLSRLAGGAIAVAGVVLAALT